MTHPHQMHAQAALHSLRAAWSALTAAAAAEARAIALDPADGLRSPIYGGGRGGGGGHSDPTADALLTGTRTNRPAQLLGRTATTLAWLARRLDAPHGGDSISRLFAVVSTLRPSTCAELHRWIAEQDTKIRQALGMPTALSPLPGTPACPACQIRLLRLQDAAHDRTAWTIVCTAADCLCTGDTCPCGMPVRAAGVAHIWGAGSELVARAVAGAAPTTPA